MEEISPFQDQRAKYLECYENTLKGIMSYPSMFLCNLVSGCAVFNCFYCQYPENKVKFIDTETVIRLLYEGKEQLKLKAFEACSNSGECTTHPHIKEIYKVAARLGYRLSLITSGYGIDGEFANLIANNFSYIRFSVDSFDENISNKIRNPKVGKASMHSIWSNIQRVVGYKKDIGSDCIIGVKCCLTQHNNTLNDIKCYITAANELGVNACAFKRAISPNITHRDYSDIEQYIKEAQFIYPNMKIFFKNIEPQRLEGHCWVNPLHLVVDRDGRCCACCYSYAGERNKTHYFGNVHEKSLKDIWFSPEHWKCIYGINRNLCQLEYQECKCSSINNYCKQAIVDGKLQHEFFGV